MPNSLYTSLADGRKNRKKRFAVLIDPDNHNPKSLLNLIELASLSGVDYFFAGGSLVVEDALDEILDAIRRHSSIPVILFPGNAYQLNAKAHGIFFLSLISGRNPDLLIGQQVLAAPVLRKTNLEVIPTGYMLIDGGAPTAVSYMSNTMPIPSDKEEIAMCTAMAGELLGLKVLYLDAGSGARRHIPAKMISSIRGAVELPLIAGGGIRTSENAYELCKAGADVIVVGNAIEKEPALIAEMALAIRESEVVSREFSKPDTKGRQGRESNV